MICEVTRRARLDPNWVGVRSGKMLNHNQSYGIDLSVLMLSSNNPIINVKGRRYIVDSVTKLIQSISSANQQRLMYNSIQTPQNNTVPDSLLSNDLHFNENLTPDFSYMLQHSKSPYGHNQVKSFPKNKGLMNPGTFELVIEHQR